MRQNFVDHLNVQDQQAIILSQADVRQPTQRQHVSKHLGPLRQSRPLQSSVGPHYIEPPPFRPLFCRR